MHAGQRRRLLAVLYFFGREIHREVGVPVGLVNTSVGGTPIESWVAAETQSSDPATKANFDAQTQAYLSFDEAKAPELHQKQMAIWKAAVAKAKAEGKPFVTPAPRDPLAMRRLKGGPAGLYNGKVANLAPFTVRGMLWYQGEGNAGNPGLYEKQLSQLVTSWRTLWQDEVPFAWVQLPNYRDSDSESWPRVRESMMKVLALPKTGMAITLDIGDPKDIHPKNKQDVGLRLSYWALASVYGRKVPAISGPLPSGDKVEGASVRVTLKHAEGLKTRDGGAVRGFRVAGADKVWKPAMARIEGTEVVVSKPRGIRPGGGPLRLGGEPRLQPRQRRRPAGHEASAPMTGRRPRRRARAQEVSRRRGGSSPCLPKPFELSWTSA
jgi:sialate O-acetylesterase